ncbi:sodium/proline symporter [Halogeometricum borinquense]|uniref:Na+/proline symporter n=2 Tax=Halogeometricum borinquense TaxID=60847 RepID=E4NSQ2_HALBP|nr:sodium/proline symporter [Halogeometricum borinquense]ADQ68145.1 Na+/proline symporter [Halogeometricum borinquense DSM 11551]ELY24811.1 Na+/proline symporter [Halogeometricum borinquense DSM 11551]QIB73269.1 sodium/proline symporter [Halogeometricum borinquense]QIQ77336.1 sodium/proline symporter [Halogeometricum borinquense]RYJ12954.1 sodium/proline symporter [Halogeometricum borinquense]
MEPTPMQAIPIADDPFVLLFGSLYMLLVLGIGVWGYMQTETTSDFLITGKSIGTWVLALTAFSVIQSGFGFVGGPELVYSFGTTALWIFFTAPLGFIVTWVLLAKRMRLLADIRDVMTLADGMFVRYESSWMRGLTGVGVLIGVVAYLATNLAALQYVMRAIFGLPVIWGLFIGAAILLLYSMLGGMIAGVWTDFVQALTMIVGSVLVFAFALSFGGGMTNISQNLASADPALVSPFGAMSGATATIFVALGWWILFSIGAAGQPHLITKFYMSRNLKILRWGAPIAAVTYAVSSLLAFSTGLSMRAMVEAGQTAAPKSASVVGPVFVLEHTPGVVAGLILAALLAAIMSTSDSFLNIGAAAVSRDIPRALGRPIEDDQTELRVTQAALAGLTIASTLIVYYSDALVGILGTIGWGFFAAAFFAIAALGLNWKGATREGAVAAIAIGLAINLLYSAVPRIASTIGIDGLSESVMGLYPFPSGFPVGTVALLAGIVSFVAVSLATQDRHLVPADIAVLLER